MTTRFADKVEMQNLLFAELSAMFGREVPLYDKSLLVNRVCNEAVCTLLAALFPGFQISTQQMAKTSGERHGAIRIGTPAEYRWVAGYFAAFNLEPHNFYDMTDVGSKSQPIVATAFRSSHNPEHRVFCSLLMTDYFEAALRERIEKQLAKREVFSPRAKELVKKNQADGGLTLEDAKELIKEGTTRIFKWTGQAHDHELYQDLCRAGFKIAADIACFERHHLNHLTPNTLWMDLYTTAMKFCLGEMDAAAHQRKAASALERLEKFVDKDFLRLHFKHLSADTVENFIRSEVNAGLISNLAEKMTKRLEEPDLSLKNAGHAGFKDSTEGPPEGTPVLLRQDAYKALTEPVTFIQSDGSTVASSHTARFGEIEQRFYATTPSGRKLYDKCLAEAEKTRASAAMAKDPETSLRDYAVCFTAFPKNLSDLLGKNLVHGLYSITAKGTAAQKEGLIQGADLADWLRLGYVRVDGLRYEDFLPVSAAGIFASNLGQYGTKSMAAKKVYTKQMLEEVLGRKIIQSEKLYAEMEAESIRRVESEFSPMNSAVGKNKAAALTPVN